MYFFYNGGIGVEVMVAEVELVQAKIEWGTLELNMPDQNVNGFIWR